MLCTTTSVAAQYTVRFVVNKFPPYHHVKDSVFLAGNFNGWNPHDAKLSLANGGITIELKKGMYEYKFTRGSWDEVESGAGAFPVQNHSISVESDTTVFTEIDHWADHFPKKEKESTACKNVRILDTAFYMPQLARHRRVWIYLPESYATSKKKYPVLYMQDGQNVFDNATAAYGEWGVDEAMDSLCRERAEVVVVAVDHGGERRISEYSPFDTQQYGKGEGDAYVDFLAYTLVPYINRHYRTKKAAKYTAVAGSSMGGLISLYATMKHPAVFGAAGVFSPAFWMAPGLKDYAAKRASKVKGRIYFYAGGLESERMVPDMLQIFETLNGRSKVELKSHIRAEGRHTESVWREEFPLFYDWLFPKAEN